MTAPAPTTPIVTDSTGHEWALKSDGDRVCISGNYHDRSHATLAAQRGPLRAVES